MNSSSVTEYPPTVDLYNLRLHQQQQHQLHDHHLPLQFPQHKYGHPSDKMPRDAMWEGKDHLKRQQYQVYNKPYFHHPPNDDEKNGFHPHHVHLKTEQHDPSSFTDNSTVHHQAPPLTMTTTMYAREDNISQSSNITTLSSPITDSPSKKKTRGRKPVTTEPVNQQNRKSSSTGLPVEKKKYKRESHNAVERRRRNNINDNIKSLGELLPESLREGKLNKGSILKGSVTYIHMLNDQLSKYQERLEMLQYEAANYSSVSSTL